MVAQDVAEAIVVTREVSVDLVKMAVVIVVVVIAGLALAVEVMVADRRSSGPFAGVARALSCRSHSTSS